MRPVILHHLRRGFVLLLIAFAVSAAARVAAQPIGPTQPVTLEHADTFIGHPDPATGGNVIEMNGHVVLLQGVVRIEADNALMYEAQNRAVLTGNIKVTQPDMVLTGPRAEYDGNSRLVNAPSGVTIAEKGSTIRAGAGDYNMYDRHARFRNGVVMNDGKNTLRGAAGEYFTLERRAIFTGGVRVDSDSGSITAGTMTYWRDTREMYAVGSVVVTSKQNSARLTSDTLRNRPNDGYTLATGRPKLVQIDTAAADSSGVVHRDTTVITSMVMEAHRGDREEYVATDSVHLTRGDLQAVAGRARYIVSDSVIALGAARTLADSVHADSAHADSGHVAPTTKPPDTSIVAGVSPPSTRKIGPLPVVWYQNSQLTGDSITIALAGKTVRTIDVDRSAFAVSQGKQRSRYDQLAALRLIFDIEQDTIRLVRACGLASSIYFVSDQGHPSGVNRASGDTINITFDRGEAATIEVLGRRARAEGEYFPEKMVVGHESSFRLAGFRWYGRSGIAEQGVGAAASEPSNDDGSSSKPVPRQGRASQVRRP